MSEPSIAVLHGNYFQRGGGEVVADAIAEAFNAPLYYGFGNESAIPDDDIDRIQVFNFRPSAGWAINKLSGRFWQFRDACFAWFGQHLPELYEYDIIIQSGNEFGWFVPMDDQIVVKYVHSPPRSSYDLFHETGESILQRAYATAVRTLYRPTTTFPDRYVANSELVQRRITKYWGKESTVIYPPVAIDGYGADRGETDETLYLTFNRLYRHKRTREIVEAFADLPDRRLVVGGEGPEQETLEATATDNVDIRGYLDEEEKRDLLSRARALVYNARNEDFGIIPIEAYASGTPVIGVDDGFTRYQIADGRNGIIFEDGTSASDIYWAITRFEEEGITADAAQLECYAEHFSRERFEQELHQAVTDAIDEASIDGVAEHVDWGEGAPEADHALADGGDRR